MFTSALLLNSYGDVPGYVSLLIVFIGVVMSLMSVGRSVEIVKGGVVLSYGFPIVLFKLTLTDIVHVTDVTELERGKLFRYFKTQLILYTIMIAYPLLYIIVKESLPPLRYLTLLSIPVCIGVGLIVYFMLTSSTYEKFTKYVGYILSAVFITLDFAIVNYYRCIFNRSIISDIDTLLPLMTGQVLAFFFFIPLAVVKRHVIVLEDANGRRCAIVTASEEDARLLVEFIAKEVMAYA